MNLQELLDELPLELIYKIMSYILKPQPKELMEDIRNYHFYKDLGLKLYKNRFNEEEYKNWFTNDIGGYLNEDKAIMNGLVDNELLEFNVLMFDDPYQYNLIRNWKLKF